MIRNKAASLHKKQNIEWRSHEPSRLETFSDAVFAFALTLIIVSIEVPKSFDELFETMKGTLSFAACFAMLFVIWNSQNIFFRRYALNDNVTLLLNAILLFTVLVYAYPLKFLSMLIFAGSEYMQNGHLVPKIKPDQIRTLMFIYDLGYMVIYLLFYLMYRNAQKYAQHIGLSDKEIFETKTVAGINLLSVGIGVLALLLSMVLPLKIAGASGFVYFLIPVSYSFWFSRRGKRSRELYPE